MPPRVIKIKVPSDAKHDEITKAVNAKLTRRTTSLLRKSQEVVLSIFVFERAKSAVAKEPRNPDRVLRQERGSAQKRPKSIGQ